jgi:hypothetical protein
MGPGKILNQVMNGKKTMAVFAHHFAFYKSAKASYQQIAQMNC